MSKLNFLFLVVFLISCNRIEIKLENTSPSLENLVKTALSSLRSPNKDEFEKGILTKKEHREYFWNYVGERFSSDPGMTADMAYEFMSMETHLAAEELNTSLILKFII